MVATYSATVHSSWTTGVWHDPFGWTCVMTFQFLRYRMLTLTTSDTLETTRARVTIVLQAILVAANVCVRALPHTLMIICVPRHADPEVWFDLPIHPDTPLAVAHQILHCLAFGNSFSAPDSTSDARFLLLAAHHLQSAYLWSHILPVLS